MSKELERFKREVRKKLYIDVNLLTIIISSIFIGSVTIIVLNNFFKIGVFNLLIVNQVFIMVFLFWIITYLYKWIP